MPKPLRLQQAQVWKVGDNFIRITRLERLAVEYKVMPGHAGKGGAFHRVTKKEFCRLIKTATLQSSAPALEPGPIGPE